MDQDLMIECPIQEDLKQAMDLGEQFLIVTRSLQRDLEVCEFCNALDGCQMVQSLNRCIDEMTLEIIEEWGIDL